MHLFSFVTLCSVWCHLGNAQIPPDYAQSVQGYQDEPGSYEEGDHGGQLNENPNLHEKQDGQNPEKEYEADSKHPEPDDDDPNLAENLRPFINRGPPTRGETYKYAATMYTHLYLTRKKVIQTRRPNKTSTPTVLWDQYFIRNRVKSKIRVHQIKTHYRKEYRTRLCKMVNECVGGLLHNSTNHTRDQLMDEYRKIREEQMIRADDRMFNKFIRRMDTVLQSGRYEKWQFHQNVTHRPWFNDEENLMFTDRVDKRMIMEIRSLARLLRKDIHTWFDIADNWFLRTYFRIPYNVSLYQRFPHALNYTEQF
ncbi:hypothetical protein WDU94_006836 [Cyamophila willieti]